MTEHLITVTNPAAPWSSIPDTTENVLRDLELYTLDPKFEFSGDFVDHSPQWLYKENAIEYAGCCFIFGGFLAHDHTFRLVTDDAALISEISDAVQRNKCRPEYQEARARMIAELPVLSLQNAHVGRCYAFRDSWLKLTGIFHFKEEEANSNVLFYLDYWRGIDWQGHNVGGPFHDGRTISKVQNRVGQQAGRVTK